MMTTLIIHVSDETTRGIWRLAAAEGITPAEWVARVLLRHIYPDFDTKEWGEADRREKIREVAAGITFSDLPEGLTL